MKHSSSAIVILVNLLLAAALHGQVKGNYSTSLSGIYSMPIGSLADRFKPTSGVLIAFGQRVESDVLWEGFVETMEYSKGNSDNLYIKDLDVDVKLYGVGAQVQYTVVNNNWPVQPYLSAGSTLYRFFERRGAHAVDSTNAIILPSLNRNEWSFGFSAGAGVLVWIHDDISLSAGLRYHIVNAELWPALALRLENVSGLQSLQALCGIRFEF